MKKGRTLECLVATIEKALSKYELSKVESPKRLLDRRTSRMREHDVVITHKVDRHIFLTAIECRDRSAKVGTPDVESFITKCADTGVDHGIIVSSKGFTKPAQIKAKDAGIRCLNVEQAESFNWLLMNSVTKVTTELVHHDWRFFPKDKSITNLDNFRIMVNDNQEFTKELLTMNAIRALNMLREGDPPNLQPGEYSKLVEFNVGNFKLKRNGDGKNFPLEKTSCCLTYKIIHKREPLELSTYKESLSEENISEFARTPPIEISDKTGRIVMVRNDQQETQVLFSLRK